MRPKIIVGDRVAWPVPGGESQGVVTRTSDVGPNQLLTVACDEGGRHVVVIDPNGPDGRTVMASLADAKAAEGLARLILSGCDPHIPVGAQLNMLATAVLAAGATKTPTAEIDR